MACGDQRERWAGSGLLVAEKQFRRVQGHKQIPVLLRELEALAPAELPNGCSARLSAIHPQPRVINTDQARIYDSAIPAAKEEATLRRRCRHRPVQYLNIVLEQDHRAIKRRVKAKQGFREFQAARRTIQGYEAMHMIRKGQARWVSGSVTDPVHQQAVRGGCMRRRPVDSTNRSLAAF